MVVDNTQKTSNAIFSTTTKVKEKNTSADEFQATLNEDGTLRIKAEKRINHKTEPVANWEKLLEITDAANSYEALSIVFQATINPPTSPTTGY